MTRFSLRWVAALCLLAGLLLPRTAAAQVAPGFDPSLILQAPVRTVNPGSVPVLWIRLFVTLEADIVSSTGTVSMEAAAGPDSLLVLNVSDLDITSVSVDGWRLEAGRLYIPVPDDADGTFRVDIDYSIHSAFRSVQAGGRVLALWTSSLPGRATWMPLPVDEVSAMDLDVSVAAPRSWKLAVAGSDAEDPSMTLDGRTVIRSTWLDAFPRAAGFLAWQDRAGDMITTLDAEGLAAHLDLDDAWLSAVLGAAAASDWTLLTVDGESIPAAFLGFSVRSTGALDRGDAWKRRYEGLWRNYQLALTPRLGRLAPTDYWIETGLASWLAVERIRQVEGDGAAGLVLDDLRRRYLAEAAVYQRPLVWDRWNVASDLRDRHAEAKGAWVFRMLHERLGTTAFNEGLTRFFALARERVVDSETLREQLEIVSREDLGDFFDTWVYAAGHPVISLSYRFDSGSEQTDLELVQHQDGPLVPETFVFDAAFQYSTLAETNSVTLRVDERERATRIPTGIAPRFIHPDALATVPLDFAQPPGKADLVSQLRYSMDAASTIRSLHLLSASSLDPALLLGLRSAISAGTDPAVLAEAAPVLGRMAPSSSARTQLEEWTRHPDARVRAAAVRALSAFTGSPEAWAAALAVANTGTEAVELAAAVETLARLRPERAWTILQSALVTPSEDELVRITALELIGPDTADDGDVAEAVLPLLDLGPDVSAAALRCLARLFPDGPRTTRETEAWLTDPSSIRREAAISIVETRENEDLPVSRLRLALEREPDVSLRRRLEALLDRAK